MFGKLMSAAMVIGLVQVGCTGIAPQTKCENTKTPAVISNECKKNQRDQKDGAKHECKKGKKAQCDRKAGAKHECKKTKRSNQQSDLS